LKGVEISNAEQLLAAVDAGNKDFLEGNAQLVT
jgi:hypothetical protein